ncbi:hypothetical protein DAI22_12g160001 [Oryza sativa Japonica Group]|nr:hypothetical protein DAI22_12g160001 [Oryza sativa Japonica Group]
MAWSACPLFLKCGAFLSAFQCSTYHLYIWANYHRWGTGYISALDHIMFNSIEKFG